MKKHLGEEHGYVELLMMIPIIVIVLIIFLNPSVITDLLSGGSSGGSHSCVIDIKTNACAK